MVDNRLSSDVPAPEAAECAFGEVCGHWALPAHERCAECVQGKKEDAP